MKELLFRFLAGGVLVSAFALLGDLFKPKSFAGLFGAAPSIALATLGLEILVKGRAQAAAECGSMWAGGVAFLVYASCVSWALMRFRKSALKTTVAAVPVWFGVALGLWAFFLR